MTETYLTSYLSPSHRATLWCGYNRKGPYLHVCSRNFGLSVRVTTALVSYLRKTVDTVRHLFMDSRETV